MNHQPSSTSAYRMLIMHGEEVKRRFYDKFVIDLDTGCWNWTHCKRPVGYGCMKVCGKLVSSHRLSFEIHHGEIPSGMFVMHSCDNRLCVNPDHLSIGTHADNMRDAARKGRIPMCNRPIHNAKFTQSDVCRMIDLRNSGMSYNKIAIEFGSSHSVVSKWINGISYKFKPSDK